MIEVLAQISNVTWVLIAVAVVAVGANIAFAKKVLNSLNSDPLDERNPVVPTPLVDAAKSQPAESLRTNVAAPRPRRLQPPASVTETPAANVPEVTAPPRPVKLNAPAVKEAEPAEPVLASLAAPRKEEKPADVPPRIETPIPIGALVFGGMDNGSKAPVVAPGLPVEAKESAAPSSEKAVPLPSPVTKPGEVPTTGRKFFEPVPPPAQSAPVGPTPFRDESKQGVVLPHLFASLTAPASGKKAPVEPAVGTKGTPASDPKPPVGPAVPKIAEIIAITPAPRSGVSKAERAGDGLPPVSGERSEDEKKALLTPAPEPAASTGLVLTPVEPKPAPVVAKLAETSTEPAAKPETKPATGKADPEPVLSPAVADILPATKPPVETKSIKGPRVFLPGKFFGRANKEKDAAEAKAAKEAADKAASSVPTAPAAPEAVKTEAELPKITTPTSAPGLVVPPVEEVPTAVEAKKDALDAKPAVPVETPRVPAPVAKVEEPKMPVPAVQMEAPETPVPATEKPGSKASEPAKPASEPAAAMEPEKPAVEPAPASKRVESTDGDKPAPGAEPAPEKPAAKSEPVPAASLVAPPQDDPKEKPAVKSEPVPAPKPAAPVEEKVTSAVKSFFSREKAPLPPPAAAPSSPPPPTPAAPTPEPIAEPLVPVIASAPALEPEPVPAAVDPEIPASPEATTTPAPAVSIIQPQSVMPPNDTTTSLPNNGRASAQLTIGFEITSLQLTPFFKLGSVQLKALSNVVSLHLVATQAADSPLAAGISFQIEHVDLDGASHLKSILLKPLGESRTITAPVSKLQVDNVAVTGGGDGSPISVTTSEQASTAVQLFGTFTIAAMDFTPAFEIGSLRLEPTSNTVLLRVAPSSRPTALDLPPSFEVAAVQLGDGAQITGMRLTPSGAKQ